ncbi:hypothetical protein HZF24_03265 [Sedimentibacter hydroxybenzoicus DSM 7310]|uniref:Uncharacterized protein n=1 Tax=Sedimentibacter hydroxybenzoicus DSM 7310 TaxID=1123245 RepID=A0A974BHR8_SEDHY|nr:hypothetical protein [Sedimentibacter hydroxybenzoicus]NYB73156.1 hypothetical protein [Sedimentibacter hydroxybenzoicus DSM 7310]
MKRKILSLLLAVAMLLSLMAGLSGCGSGNQAMTPGTQKSETFTVEDGQTALASEDGAAIDFGCLLEAGDELTIQKVSPASIDSDVEIYAYDFKLSSGQPEGTVELAIPYDDAGLGADEELLSVCGKYLNEQSGQWEDVLYTVDAEANKVHILTDHLSTYSVFKVTNAGKRSEYISDVNVYAAYMTTKQAEQLLKTYAEQGVSWQEDVISAFLNANNSLPMFAETNIPTLVSLGGAYDDMITEPFGNALTVLGIATSCTQFAYDAYSNGLTSKETSISGMKTVLNLGLNLASSKKYLLDSFQVAYVGVGVIDIALTDVMNFAIDTKYESTKNMYDAYYARPENKRRVKDWYDLFKKIYKENKSAPQTALDKMQSEIDNYVNKYWEVAASDWDSWIDAFDKNGNLSKYPWPSESDREKISSNYKAEIYDYLQVMFQSLSRDMYFDALSRREKEYKQLAAQLNTIYTITIKEQEIEGEQPKWANCYVKLAPLSDKATAKAWTIKLDDKSNGQLKFTLLAHETAGFPIKLEFFKTQKDWEEGKVAASTKLKPFTNTEKTFTIKTQAEKVDCSGTFTGVLHVAETGKDIDVTTAVTFEKDFGDGSYYKIVCSNNETQSTYINGSYFVRWSTGEANIAGAKFVFSADGTSFSASMRDHNDKEWGVITCQR